MSRFPKKGLIRRALDAAKERDHQRAHAKTRRVEDAIVAALERLAKTLKIHSMPINVVSHVPQHRVVKVYLEVDGLHFLVIGVNVYYITRDPDTGRIIKTRQIGSLSGLGDLIDADITADARPDDR